ncbi:MAG: AAA family ATPase [Candidatus Thermoplasmatota archaeon]|nr:AAA family ATPase [Candidatus Thermoplasmatota archaeon]
MKIIAFTGMPFSGKSVAVKIAKDKGIMVVRMGDFVWEETKRQGKKLDDKNVSEVANSMRIKFGKNIWAKRTIEKIKSLGEKDLVIIDGIRSNEEIETFKKELGNDFILVAITASEKVRIQRAMLRKREDDSENLNDIKNRDRREIGWGLDSVIASADIVVSNEGSLEDFRKKITNMFDKYKK